MPKRREHLTLRPVVRRPAGRRGSEGCAGSSSSSANTAPAQSATTCAYAPEQALPQQVMLGVFMRALLFPTLLCALSQVSWPRCMTHIWAQRLPWDPLGIIGIPYIEHSPLPLFF